MTSRSFVEIEGELAEQVKLFCFLRGLTMRDFSTRAIREALEPYRAWLESVRRLKTPPQ